MTTEPEPVSAPAPGADAAPGELALSRRSKRRTERRRNTRLSVVGVLGEVFLTGGVLVFLFLGWQLWLNDIIVGNQQTANAMEIVKQWEAEAPTPPPPADDEQEVEEEPDYGEPIVTVPPASGEAFGVLYVPRFGTDFARPLAEGVRQDQVLRNIKYGIGRYTTSQMPGEPGNFVLASHRTTWGAGFKDIQKLRVGDKIYVQTKDGWYTYVYRSLEYVQPTEVDVIAPVPRHAGTEATESIITLTTCNPIYMSWERVIAYGVYESWQPASAGMPADLAAVWTGEA